MTNVEDLMRLVDSLADAAFATGQAQAGIRPVCVLPDTKHLRRRIEHALIPLCTELEVLRDAVEAAYDFITAMSSDPDCDDDGTQGAIRATRRKMAEALGNALPRLLYEKREGQKLFGLRCRELAEENAHLRDALVKAEENLRRPLPSRPDFRASWNPPSNYSDAYDWHQYLDKPEEKASQPVNGPGTAVDSRSAASMSSSAFHSQPSGIVSSGVVAPSRATLSNESLPRLERWAIVLESALDIGFGDDVRTGGKPELGYALLSNAKTFHTEDAARNAHRESQLPVGWVIMPLSRLLPDVYASPPEPENPAARRLTKKELEDAAFPVLRAVNSDRLWRELTYSSGPYEVTCAKHVLVDIARALESAIAALWGVKLP